MPPQGRQLIHLHDFDVSAEIGTVLSEVGIDIEHSSVVMAHHAQSIVFHSVSDPGGFDPAGDFIPGDRIVFEGFGGAGCVLAGGCPFPGALPAGGAFCGGLGPSAASSSL